MNTHRITEYSPACLPAYVANGWLGLRIGRCPLFGNIALLNGYFGIHEYERIEGLEPAPYPLGGDLSLDGLALSQRPDLLTFREQTYDFAAGELRTRFDVTANGVTAHVEVLTFCSRSMPALALQEVCVRTEQPCTLTLRAGIDPDGLPGRCVQRLQPNKAWRIADGALRWESRGALTTCGAAYIAEFEGEPSATPVRDFFGNESPLFTDYTVAAQPGHTYIMRQYGCLVPDGLHSQPELQAIRLARIGQQQGFATLREENRAAWAEIWQGRIRLLGAGERWQELTDAAYFYQHTSAHFAMPGSIPAFGLGHRHYFGMIMWDTETYQLPTLLLTAPRTARTVLDFRTRTLEAARRQALLHGYDGVQFANGGRRGEEMVPYWAAAVFAEQHSNLAVALAFAQYAQATGDQRYLAQQAWPVLEGVAAWVVSRVKRTGRGFEIRHITGIDEEIENIHNNAYTNLLAAQVLREAQATAVQLGISPPAAWEEIARGMFLPIDPATQALRKHDRYVDSTATFFNPETLVAFFPYNCQVEDAVRQATLQHDLAHAASYLGNPLMSPFVAVLAARQGDRQFALDLFKRGVEDYTADPFLTYVEYPDWQRRDKAPAAVPYLANAGAYLVSCLYGLTGLQLGPGDPQSWCRYPVAMPTGWDGLEVERIWAHGQPMRLTAHHGAAHAELHAL